MFGRIRGFVSICVLVAAGVLSPVGALAQTNTPTPTRTPTPTPTSTPNFWAPDLRDADGWYLCVFPHVGGEPALLDCYPLQWTLVGGGDAISEQWNMQVDAVDLGVGDPGEAGSYVTVWVVPPSHTKSFQYQCDVALAQGGTGAFAYFDHGIPGSFFLEDGSERHLLSSDGAAVPGSTPPSYYNLSSEAFMTYRAGADDLFWTKRVTDFGDTEVFAGAVCSAGSCFAEVSAECRVVEYEMFPSYSWTPSPWDYASTPTITPSPTISGNVAWDTPVPWNTPVAWVPTPDSSAVISIGVPGPETCRVVLPGWSVSIPPVTGMSGTVGWDSLEVCAAETPMAVGFMGFDFVAWAVMMLLVMGLGAIYAIFRSGQ